jgi:hypothetical protein
MYTDEAAVDGESAPVDALPAGDAESVDDENETDDEAAAVASTAVADDAVAVVDSTAAENEPAVEGQSREAQIADERTSDARAQITPGLLMIFTSQKRNPSATPWRWVKGREGSESSSHHTFPSKAVDQSLAHRFPGSRVILLAAPSQSNFSSGMVQSSSPPTVAGPRWLLTSFPRGKRSPVRTR